MSQVSNYPISKDIADRIFEVFTKTIVNIREKNEAEEFVSDLFTPTEKIMLAKRVAIAFLLLKKYKYREISQVLRVSLPTISTVNLSLKYGKGGYEKIISKIANKENIEEILGKLVENTLSMPASLSKGGGLWRNLHNEMKKQNKKTVSSFNKMI